MSHITPPAKQTRINPNEANYPAVMRLRAELQQLIGQEGLDLSEGLGRLVITTSKDLILNKPGHFQLSSHTLASISPSSQLQNVLAEQRVATARAMDSIGHTDESTIFRRAGSANWMMILPDGSDPSRWRAQTFDIQGLSGHWTFPDRNSALHAATMDGFTTRDDAALDRIQDSPEFQRGLFALDVAARINTQSITQPEGDRLMGEYDSCAKMLHNVAEKGAQAFVTAGGEVMCLLADRIAKGTGVAVFLHEVMHRYGKKVLGPAGCEHLARGVEHWDKRSPKSVEHDIFKAASRRARQAANGSETLFDDELIAYAVEEAMARGLQPNAEAHPTSAPGWLNAVTCTLRGVMQSISGGNADALPAQINAQSLVDLAYAFAQLESPERVQRIMEMLTPREQQSLISWVERQGAPIWFSELERRVRTKGPPRMEAGKWASWIDAQVKKGIKPDEIHWSGVNDWLRSLAPDQSVLRADILSFLQHNGVEIEEVVLNDALSVSRSLAVSDVYTEGNQWTVVFSDGATIGISQKIANDKAQAIEKARTILGEDDSGSDAPSAAKYAQYTLPGGERYREVLLTLKMTESRSNSFHSAHWDDHPNVIAHVRLTDRTDSEGARVLFVEEMQSDWSQLGRRHGIRTGQEQAERLVAPLERIELIQAMQVRAKRNEIAAGATEAEADESVRTTPPALLSELASMGREYNELVKREARDWALVQEQMSRVPPGPYINTTDGWVNLVLKRLVTMAACGGYDKVAFITGEQAARRHDLSKEIWDLEFAASWTAGEPGTLKAWDQDGKPVLNVRLTAEKLDEHIGKTVAETLLKQTPMMAAFPTYTLSGERLQIGGEGMRAFYDGIVPSAMKCLLRKLGEETPNKVNAMIDRIDLGAKSCRPGPQPQPGFKITDAMRSLVAGGLPLFSQMPPKNVALETAMVKARYAGTDQWMKAPNGASSHLDARQWVQVRTQSFKDWFGDWEGDPENSSKALDANGEPQVFYHGSHRAGFSEFYTDGEGKTRGTGAFFTDNFSMASTYSGSNHDAPLYRADQLFENPELMDDLEIEVGLLVEAPTSYGFKRWDWYEDEESARSELDLAAGDGIVSKPGYRACKGYYDECTGDKDEILAFLEGISTESPGVYSVFINTRELMQIDWQDKNWDEGPVETVWNVLDQHGHIEETLYDKAEVTAYLNKYPGSTIKNSQQQLYESTDDAARQVRNCGVDGVLIKDVWDSGPRGSCDSGNVLVVFKPENIKSADINCGAFDPRDADIRMSVPAWKKDSLEQESPLKDRLERPRSLVG